MVQEKEKVGEGQVLSDVEDSLTRFSPDDDSFVRLIHEDTKTRLGYGVPSKIIRAVNSFSYNPLWGD